MVYIRKKRKRAFFRAGVLFLALAFLIGAALRAVNSRLDAFIIPLARTGLTCEITRLINESVAEALAESGAELAEAVYDTGGRIRSVRVDSFALNLLRADISVRAAGKLAALEKFYVTTDISNIIVDEIFFCRLPVTFTVDVILVGGVETDVKSEFVSAGINQTNYRLSLTVSASITADVVSAFTVDVATSVNLFDMLIVGDVPTVVWGRGE
jgi:sporulation protein YunB